VIALARELRLHYRVTKLRALLWLLRRLMVRAERLSRPEG
jgi:hypothetical protein